MSSEPSLISLLYEAVNSPFGLVIETNEAERLRQKLYAIRKSQPLFHSLSFIISPMNGLDLWIVRKPSDEER